MSNYIPHHRKKRDILKKREHRLIKAIEANLSPGKMASFAIKVREAQIRVINVKRSQLRAAESDENNTLLAKFDQESKHWLSLSDDEIIEMYKHQTITNGKK
jgi:hypothetical protein